MGRSKEQLKVTFLFLASGTSWVLLMDIQEKASVTVRLLFPWRGFGKNVRINAILITLRFEVLVRNLGAATQHAVAKGGKNELVSTIKLGKISPHLMFCYTRKGQYHKEPMHCPGDVSTLQP